MIIYNELKKLFQHAFTETLEIPAENIDPLLRLASKPQFGDYQANFAMSLAKTLKQNPLTLATAVVNKLPPNMIIQNIEVVPPGFVNIKISDAYLAHNLQTLLQDARVGIPLLPDAELTTLVIDYGGANIAKEMHVGHIRSTILGDALVRLFVYLGYQVIRQNHLGDWGTQFGMLIEHIMEENIEVKNLDNIEELNHLYQTAKKRFDVDLTFKENARKRVVALQQGELASNEIWRNLVAKSEDHFQKLYSELDVLLQKNDNCGESFYNPLLPALVQELEQKQIATTSDDAVVIFLPGFVTSENTPLPLIIRKSNGAYLYATTDLAAVKYRLETLKANRLIYVTDARQKQHFSMIFAAATLAGWVKKEVRLDHVAFGSILGEDGKPFKTRSGETIKLAALLKEATQRAYQILNTRESEFSEEEKWVIAKAVGIGSLKYADLSSEAIKDYIFSWERMLSFEGNTGPYLQNAYVRIQSIFRKANMNDINQIMVEEKRLIQFSSEIEHMLAVKVLVFSETIMEITDSLAIYRLCNYLYELASLFHKFYETQPILNAPDKTIQYSRLCICEATAKVLKTGLNLLGIKILEKM